MSKLEKHKDTMEQFVKQLNKEVNDLNEMEYDAAFDLLSKGAIECAAKVDDRDETITKLLDFIKKTSVIEYNANGGVIRGSQTYNHALKIAGRSK